MNLLNEKRYLDQAEMLANRVNKKFKHLKKSFARQNIDVFRLYDWDIPEIRVAVDWYAGHLVIAEYTRKQTIDGWLEILGGIIADKLGVPFENVHLKERRMGQHDGKRYERIGYTNKKIVMSERDLDFYVNPYDYVDTGLFSDHRDTRQMVREMAFEKDFLNLYCYTGSFSCYAAKGGSKSTTSVDRSQTAINWLKENMALNMIPEKGNKLIARPVDDFLKQAKSENRTFDLAVVEPPSFSTSRDSSSEFDISIEHPFLLKQVIELMRKNGTIFFSTNHQNFHPRLEHLNVSDIQEITTKTIPVDYVNKRKKIHRCWQITV